MIKFLDAFAKQFGENRKLGEDFFKSTIAVKVGQLQLRMPYVMIAIAAANLLSQKVVDDVAKLIVKADIDRLKVKDAVEKVTQCNNMLKEGWDATARLLADGQMDDSTAAVCVGRYFNRMALHLVGKEKQGFEKIEFASFAAIQTALVGDLAKAGCNDVEQKPQASEPSADSKVALKDIDVVSDPVVDAQERGIEVGKKFYEKTVGSSHGIYTLTSMSVDGCELIEITAGRCEPKRVSVELHSFLKFWTQYKGAVVEQIDAAIINDRLFENSQAVMLDKAKATAFLSIQSFAAELTYSVLYYNNPSMVCAAEAVGKNELILAPVVEMRCMSAEGTQNNARVHVGKVSLFLTEPTKPRKAADGT